MSAAPKRARKKPLAGKTVADKPASRAHVAGGGHDIIDRRQIEALASPLRQEIVDALAQQGPLTIHALGEQLGRAPDGLYYHVRKLLRIGLLREIGSVASGGRDAQRYDVIGRPLRIVQQPGNAPQLAAVKRSVSALLRTTQRDAHRAIDRSLPRLASEPPDLVGMRARTWLTDAQLVRVRALLAELAEIATNGRANKNGRCFGLTYMLTPLVSARLGVLENKETK